MSYTSWHTYGYGICVSDITVPSVERLQKLLAMAPVLEKNIREWLDECGISEPDMTTIWSSIRISDSDWPLF